MREVPTESPLVFAAMVLLSLPLAALFWKAFQRLGAEEPYQRKWWHFGYWSAFWTPQLRVLHAQVMRALLTGIAATMLFGIGVAGLLGIPLPPRGENGHSSRYPLEAQAQRQYPTPANTPSVPQAQAALLTKPGDAQTHLRLGHALYRAGEFVKAAAEFERTAKLEPEKPAAHFWLGYARMAAGQPENAIAAFQHLARHPALTPEEVSSAHLEIANCFAALGHEEKAAESYRKSLSYNPQQGIASLALGSYLAQQGKRDEAKQRFVDALRDLRDWSLRARAHADLGRLAEEDGDRQTAAREYRMALELDGHNQWARQRLAQVE